MDGAPLKKAPFQIRKREPHPSDLNELIYKELKTTWAVLTGAPITKAPGVRMREPHSLRLNEHFMMSSGLI